MAFVYHMGLDVTKRCYYNVTADSFEDAIEKLKAFANADETERDHSNIDLVSDNDDHPTADADSIDESEPIDVKCAGCGETVEDESEHECGSAEDESGAAAEVAGSGS